MGFIITKRDGVEVEFNKDKIIKAIMSAMVEVNELDYDVAEGIAKDIEEAQKDKSVVEIERRVIRELYLSNFNKTAEAYSEYKARRDLLRGKSKIERKFLSSEFISKYKHELDPFTNELGKFVYYRTYSRPLPSENRRERWWETVARVIEFNFDLQLKAMERKGIQLTQSLRQQLVEEAQEAYDLMYNLKLFPSGRTLWVGGTPSSYMYPLSNFNCFSRDTRFITNKGIKSFKDFEDGDTANVLCETGGWREARITNFGKDELLTITLRRGKSTKIVNATKNHRWFVEKGVGLGRFITKTTEELQVGDTLREKRRYEKQNIVPCNIGIQHGMVYGDGSYDKLKNHCRIALVGEKQELLKHFTSGSVSAVGEHDQTLVYGLPHNWKNLPEIDANIEYLYGFLIGLFATDGSNTNGQHTISSSNKKTLEFVANVCSLTGIKCGNISIPREYSPYDGTYSPCYSITLFAETIPTNFLLRKNHIKNHTGGNKKSLWKVESVESTGLVEEVWCVEEPETHTFTLEGNILTHNCSFVTIDHLDKFSEIFFVLMLGTGVGLSVERKYVSKLPKINTNIQLLSKAYEPVDKKNRLEHTELHILNNTAIELIVGDSKSGWAEAIKYYFDIISSRQYEDIKYIFINYNNVRPAGERLKTFGGFASGHTAIQQMFDKINKIFQRHKGSQWYKIRPIDALDIATTIAENVVAGGTRRSAEIVFCDPDEIEVLEAKANLYINVDGQWQANKDIIHRSLSNNTVFYQERPEREVLHKQFETMRYSGEPAIANFKAMQKRRHDVQGGNPLTY